MKQALTTTPQDRFNTAVDTRIVNMLHHLRKGKGKGKGKGKAGKDNIDPTLVYLADSQGNADEPTIGGIYDRSKNRFTANVTRKARAAATAVIPAAVYGTQWITAAVHKNGKFASKMLRIIWGGNKGRRCPEAVLAVLHDPTRVDPLYASAFRTIMTARRTLRKCEARMDKFYENLVHLQKGTMPKGTIGPAAGFCLAANVMGASVIAQEGKVWLRAELGAVVNLLTDNSTYLAQSMRDAARLTIMEGLSERANSRSRKRMDGTWAYGREDLRNIPRYVDHKTTCQLINGKSSTPKYGVGSIWTDNKRRERRRLNGKGKQLLKQIIAGSIRPPHRLVHTGVCDSAKCPLCEHTKRDAAHLFWDCDGMQKVRARHMQSIQKIIEKATGMSVWRGQALRAVIANNAFRNCFICPGQECPIRAANDIDCYDTRLDCTNEHVIFWPEENNWERVDCQDYYRVYTDGSALRPETKDTARAGWDVFYDQGSHHNVAEKLAGPTQSSYWGEVRAALHAIATAGTNIIVIAECKSVVDIINWLIEGEDLPNEITDRDLWEQIQFFIRGNESNYRVRWMPSHLSDKGKFDKKKKAMDAGLVTQEDIFANDSADELAKLGANLHNFWAHTAALQDDIKNVTHIAQFIAAEIWHVFLQRSEDNGESDAEYESLLMAALQDDLGCNAYPQEDDDPFAFGSSPWELRNDEQDPHEEQDTWIDLDEISIRADFPDVAAVQQDELPPRSQTTEPDHNGSCPEDTLQGFRSRFPD